MAGAATRQGTVTSRERVHAALAHTEPDRVPLDLGAAPVTGMHVDSVYLLRQDNFFGFPQDDWKPWTTFGGTPVLIPGLFNTEPDERGDILMYPEGDGSVPPCARMPNGGFYFDAISRQEPLDDEALDPADNAEEFTLLSDADLAHVTQEAERLSAEGKAVMFVVGDTGFGDIAFVPGLKLKHPRGIRDVQQWYMSLCLRPDHIYEVFERQCEAGLRNLEAVHAVAGDAIDVVYVSGTDFGAQDRPFVSPKLYHDLFKPFHKRVNDWIHAHTEWKSFMHSDGSIWRLLDDIVDAGFDILNPVQTSATDMDPVALKATYGEWVTSWGGGIETQTVLPFGTPDEVRAMVAERMRIFGPGGGFVFTTIHNLQSRVPVENIVALYQAVKAHRSYPRERRSGR
jgi:hypothetical protein